MDQPHICRKSLWDTTMNEEVDLARTVLDHKKVQVETAELVIRRRRRLIDREPTLPVSRLMPAMPAMPLQRQQREGPIGMLPQ